MKKLYCLKMEFFVENSKFTDMSGHYYGTREEILYWLNSNSSVSKKFSNMIKNYFKNEDDGTLFGGCDMVSFISTVDLIAETSFEINDFEYYFKNKSGIELRIKAPNAKFNAAYIRNSDGELKKIIKAEFSGLKPQSKIPAENMWMISFEQEVCRNMLSYEAMTLGSKEEMSVDIEFKSFPNCDTFFFNVFENNGSC